MTHYNPTHYNPVREDRMREIQIRARAAGLRRLEREYLRSAAREAELFAALQHDAAWAAAMRRVAHHQKVIADLWVQSMLATDGLARLRSPDREAALARRLPR